MKIKNIPSKLIQKKDISGWGQTNKTNVQIIKPQDIIQIQELIINATCKSLITRGLGRSYGDAAQLSNSYALDLKLFNQIKIDSVSQSVTAGAGVTFEELLKTIIPEGFFLPVTPGTRKVTVGGAISSDVHGKNHHVDGSFGDYILELVIIDGKGALHKLKTKEFQNVEDEDFYWATIGGMGLTGVIVEATFSLIPITTSLVKVNTNRYKSLDEIMSAMVDADKNYKYSVAWIDSLNLKGRGVLTCGEHIQINELKDKQKQDPLFYQPNSLGKPPSILPRGILNQFTVRAFNEAWYRKAPLERKNEIQKITKFFYPLDSIENWNKIYGPKGFIQYQFVIPDKSSFVIEETLKSLRKISASSFLTVLKRFGKSNKSPLSFPKAGWTLAIDVPAGIDGLFSVLNKLDELVATNNGRIYLAKDSRMSSTIFKDTYKGFSKWRKIKDKFDPNTIFYSDLAKRLLI